MTENLEQSNKVESEEIFLTKFRAEVAEMVHQEDLSRQGYGGQVKTGHMYRIEPDGSVRFILPEQLNLVDARMWERVARFRHFAEVLSPKSIPIPEGERVTREELAAYEKDVRDNFNFSRDSFRAKIANVLTGIWGQEELLATKDEDWSGGSSLS